MILQRLRKKLLILMQGLHFTSRRSRQQRKASSRSLEQKRLRRLQPGILMMQISPVKNAAPTNLFRKRKSPIQGVSILQRMQNLMKNITSHMISRPRRKRSVNLAKHSAKLKRRRLKSRKMLQSRSRLHLLKKSEKLLRRSSMIRRMRRRKRQSERSSRLKRKN